MKIKLPFLDKLHSNFTVHSTTGEIPVEGHINKASVSKWLPFEDIYNGLIHLNDGGVVAVLRVYPYNFDLLSDNEKQRAIKNVSNVFNSSKQHLQIISIGRPVDLDKYMRELGEKIQSFEGQKKRLLQEYRRYIADIIASGDAIERRYYVLIPEEKGNKAQETVKKKANEILANFQKAGLEVSVCDDYEIIDLLNTFTHPVESAYERVSLLDAPPVLEWSDNVG